MLKRGLILGSSILLYMMMISLNAVPKDFYAISAMITYIFVWISFQDDQGGRK